MSQAVLRVENVSKQYRLGVREQYLALRDVLAGWFVAPWRALSRPVDGGQWLWALRDVSFEVLPGEVLGIVGHNGAGKSTLLRILSRITRPTSGRVRLRGRVGSLLEVGTGFHPELTGRENVYLSGAVLGMARAEIERQFDEIVNFAEVERFVDTPVKRYSTGMYLRLAFAVAAHLRADVLLVDEVLAVGDAAFQKKCLGKMGAIAGTGRTVLFVSHNLDAVQRLCSRSLLLDQGRLLAHGDTPSVIGQYLARTEAAHPPGEWLPATGLRRKGSQQARVTAVRYSSDRAEQAFRPYPGGPLEVRLKIESDRDRSLGRLAVIVYDRHGRKLVNADSIALGQSVALQRGEREIGIRIKALNLNPGHYRLGWWLSDGLRGVFDFVEAALELEVVDRAEPQLGARPDADGTVFCEFQLVDEHSN